MNSDFQLFPPSASTISPEVDAITFALVALCGLVAFAVFALILGFSIRFRAGGHAPHRVMAPAGTRTRIEITWTVVPFILFMGIFTWASWIYFKMHNPPADSTEVDVIAKQWMWKFQHPDGAREIDELHVPVDTPIRLVMTSQDVIHSFFVPAFRIKQDVLPGRYTSTWFQATKTGEFHIFCTQYCGTSHALMRGKVVVMSKADFMRWQAAGISGASPGGGPAPGGATLASQGAELFRRFGCISCHGVNPGVRAPSLNGVYGSQVRLRSGESVLADENYIRESILSPNAKIVEGYQPLMPTFAGIVTEQDLLALIAYIKSLRGLHP